MKMGKKGKTVIIDLGGSMVMSDEIQINFLKKFRKFILKFLKKGNRFIIIVGGGKICRKYQDAASKITVVSNEDKDWIGIHATRLNAQLLRTIFAKEACPVVLDSPFKQVDEKKWQLFIASGWRPGWSTDYDAVLLAHRFRAEKTIVASYINYVYDKDVSKYKSAKPLKNLTWKEYSGLIDRKWTPGMRAPLDPIAAEFALKQNIEVIVMNGSDLDNLGKIIDGKNFKGTTIKN